MNPLRAFLAALVPEADEHADRMRAAGAALKVLRSEVRSLHREVAAAAARAEAVARQVAQLRRLQAGGRDTAATLDELALLMDTGHVASHVRAAVERARRHDQPAPWLAIDALWPRDVYEAMTAAIPDAIFFEGAGPSAQTLRVPPRLASVSGIAIWTFVADIVEGVALPAVAARFSDLLTSPLDSTPGRLVRRVAGCSEPPSGGKGWQQWHLVIDLSPAGSRTANTASVAVTPGGAADASAGAVAEVGAAPAGVEYTYEVWFGAKPA